MNKLHYFLKLIPPRNTFMQDMNPDEKAIIQQHVSYWHPFVENETVIVLGPVFDPNGGFGMSVLAVENEQELQALMAADPANGLCSYEFYPMRAVTKHQKI